MIDLKESLKRSIEELPKTFRIQESEYFIKIAVITKGFTILAIIILVFLVIYLFLRFYSKKCVGPIKISHITKGYKNFTWILLSKYNINYSYLVYSDVFSIWVHNYKIS